MIQQERRMMFSASWASFCFMGQPDVGFNWSREIPAGVRICVALAGTHSSSTILHFARQQRLDGR